MPRWIWLASSLGCGVAAAGVAVAFTVRRWGKDTEQLVGRIIEGGKNAASPAGAVVSFASFASLPPPVARYLRSVLQDGQRYIRAARVVQTGEFNMSASSDGWRVCAATQVYNVTPPGYVWDARIHMAPLVSVRVRDAYAAGHGTMRGAVLSLIPVVDEHDKRELDAGALQRYLAETPWFPTSLVPGQGVTWSAVDDRHARATIADGTTTASLLFEFAPSGEVTAVSTPSRFRAENGRYVACPWGGVFKRYETRSGMRVPLEAEVCWTIAGRDEPYVRIRITDVQYEHAP